MIGSESPGKALNEYGVRARVNPARHRALAEQQELDSYGATDPEPLAPSHIASVAMAETRLASRAVPNVIRYLVPIIAWGVASIALGAVIGLSAVILPPMGAFGIVAAAGLVLLWVMRICPLCRRD